MRNCFWRRSTALRKLTCRFAWITSLTVLTEQPCPVPVPVKGNITIDKPLLGIPSGSIVMLWGRQSKPLKSKLNLKEGRKKKKKRYLQTSESWMLILNQKNYRATATVNKVCPGLLPASSNDKTRVAKASYCFWWRLRKKTHKNNGIESGIVL